jgi:hypothetical protein
MDKLVSLTRAACHEFGGVTRVVQQLRNCYDDGDCKTRASILITIVNLLERGESAEQEVAEEEKIFAQSPTKCSSSEPGAGDRESIIISRFLATMK